MKFLKVKIRWKLDTHIYHVHEPYVLSKWVGRPSQFNSVLPLADSLSFFFSLFHKMVTLFINLVSLVVVLLWCFSFFFPWCSERQWICLGMGEALEEDPFVAFPPRDAWEKPWLQLQFVDTAGSLVQCTIFTLVAYYDMLTEALGLPFIPGLIYQPQIPNTVFSQKHKH